MVISHAHDPVNDEFEPIESVELVGGALCLDFVNTGSRRRFGPFRERLEDYEDFLVWSRRAGLLTEAQATSLAAQAVRRPDDAGRVLDYARALRESIYAVFSARSRGEEPAADDVERLNTALAEAGRWRRVTADDGGWRWTWDQGEEPLAWPLWPVVYSAAELLTGGDAERIKECGGPNCNWLFYDVSKNRSRRWCDMRDCGNREKQRRHRKKSASTSSPEAGLRPSQADEQSERSRQ